MSKNARHFPVSGYNLEAGLVGRSHLEMESPYLFHPALQDLWQSRAEDAGCSLGLNTSFSTYLDVMHGKGAFSIFAAGRTLRIRRGGPLYATGSGTVTPKILHLYPRFQMASKSLAHSSNRDIQAAAGDRYESWKSRGVLVRARIENEGAVDLNAIPLASELRFRDLPQERWPGHPVSLSEECAQLVAQGGVYGITDPRQLVFQPSVATLVERRVTVLYFMPGRPFDFISNWPSPVLTDEMREKGGYLRVEVCLDACHQFAPPAGMPILNVLEDRGVDLTRYEQDQFAYLGTRHLFEVEVKQAGSCQNIRNDTLVEGMAAFCSQIGAFVNHAKEKMGFIGTKDEVFAPTQSKAVMAVRERVKRPELSNSRMRYVCRTSHHRVA